MAAVTVIHDGTVTRWSTWSSPLNLELHGMKPGDAVWLPDGSAYVIQSVEETDDGVTVRVR